GLKARATGKLAPRPTQPSRGPCSISGMSARRHSSPHPSTFAPPIIPAPRSSLPRSAPNMPPRSGTPAYAPAPSVPRAPSSRSPGAQRLRVAAVETVFRKLLLFRQPDIPVTLVLVPANLVHAFHILQKRTDAF